MATHRSSDLAAIARRARTALGNPAYARRQLLLSRDLGRFERQARALREAAPRGSDRGTALIVSLSEFVYQLKLEAVIGTALRLGGCRVVVMTHAGWRWPERYFRAAGIDEFVHPEDFHVDEEAAEAEVREAVDAALAGEIGIQALRRRTFHGAHVGEQTLSSLSRRFRRGRISLDDPEIRSALGEIYELAVRSVLAGERLLDAVDPSLVVFNEKGYAGFGSVYDLALDRGADVVQFVSAGIHWRDALVFRRFTDETRRVHPTSVSAETWSHVRTLPWTEREDRELRREFDLRYGGGEMHPDAGLQAGKVVKSADEVRAQLGLDPAKKVAVVFSHVLWDANMFYGEDLFEDQETWLVETVRAAVANPELEWIVKLHPANTYKSDGSTELNDEVAIHEALGPLPPHVRLVRPDTDINTYSLFDVADVGITIRGTIGMELPCFGVPMLTAGTGRYSGLGFTVDSTTREEYLDRLAHLQDVEPLSEEETLLAKRHAYAIFRLRPLRFTSYRGQFMPADRLDHPLSHNLELVVDSPQAVETAPDLAALGRWLLDDASLDFLAEPARVA